MKKLVESGKIESGKSRGTSTAYFWSWNRKLQIRLQKNGRDQVNPNDITCKSPDAITNKQAKLQLVFLYHHDVWLDENTLFGKTNSRENSATVEVSFD